MATVFMKWLEKRPADYDRGIRLLTLGRLELMQHLLVEELVQEGTRVLEIGCGTGALTVAMAKAGAKVSAIDISPGMLAEAAKRIEKEDVEQGVDLQRMDAVMIDELYDPKSFDLIVSSLALSEMTERGRRYILRAVRKLLAPDGKLVVLDEVKPASGGSRLLLISYGLRCNSSHGCSHELRPSLWWTLRESYLVLVSTGNCSRLNW